MADYVSDKDALAQSMGQFQLWNGKMFYYHGEVLGWRLIIS